MRSNKLALLVIVGCLAASCRSRSRCVESDANRRALQAAWANDVRAMRDLLARDASIATAPGCTGGGGPIHLAASMGHADLVRLMLEHGTSVDASDDQGATPLISALVGRKNNVVSLLIARGADVNRGSKHTTPLILALEMDDADAVRQLIRHGAKVNAPSARGETPLRAMIGERLRGHGDDEALKPRDQEKMRLLLDAGADSGAPGKDGGTALHQAASCDRDDLAALLIAHGANVNAHDQSGLTPLHIAAAGGHTAVVELLLTKDADVNAEAKDGRTPLSLVFGDAAMKALLERHGGHVATVGR